MLGQRDGEAVVANRASAGSGQCGQLHGGDDHVALSNGYDLVGDRLIGEGGWRRFREPLQTNGGGEGQLKNLWSG